MSQDYIVDDGYIKCCRLDPPIDIRDFDAAYWNIVQVRAWVRWRNREWVAAYRWIDEYAFISAWLFPDVVKDVPPVVCIDSEEIFCHAVRSDQLKVYEMRGEIVDDNPLAFGTFPPEDADKRAQLRFRRDDVMAQWPEIQTVLGANGNTIANRKRCDDWFIRIMNSETPNKQKLEYIKEAQMMFGISMRQALASWTEAIKTTGRTDWSRPGRKSTRVYRNVK